MSQTLLPKEYFVIGALCLFFGILFLIWVVAKLFPAWEARQIERQQQRYEEHQPEES